MEFIPYTKQVQYHETDQMGIVHHSNYIKWFEEARCDFLNQLNYSYGQMEEKGVMILVLEVSCQYKAPVHFPEVVKILPVVSFFNGIKMTVTYEVRGASDNSLRAIGESKHCFVNKDFHLLRLQKSHPDIYETFHCLLDHAPTWRELENSY